MITSLNTFSSMFLYIYLCIYPYYSHKLIINKTETILLCLAINYFVMFLWGVAVLELDSNHKYNKELYPCFALFLITFIYPNHIT